jgi:NAD(P)-dependent dehydrogenase (short-subunit alcohol dehydrogenase family)
MNENTIPALFDLTGKVALVTGASGHLGMPMACGLAEAGATVVCASRSLARAKEVASALPFPARQQHLAVELDHLSEYSIADGFAAAVTAAKRIDILLNNGHQATAKTWHDVSGEEFTAQLANATGYFRLAKLFHDHVVQRDAAGSLILLGSMYGIVSSDPTAYEGIGPGNPVAYQVLKGGVIQMTRHLAVHWAKERIRVNAISPGPFPNQERVDDRLTERLAKRTPLGRVGDAEELKGAVVFLASEASSYVTGHNLVVDGGWTAW